MTTSAVNFDTATLPAGRELFLPAMTGLLYDTNRVPADMRSLPGTMILLFDNTVTTGGGIDAGSKCGEWAEFRFEVPVRQDPGRKGIVPS